MILRQQRRHQRYLLLIGFIFIISSISTLYVRKLSFRSLLSNHYFLDKQIQNKKSTIYYPQKRPHLTKRRFISESVELLIKEIKQNIANKQLAWLFENCFPNTLDTTVDFQFKGVKQSPNTFITEGNIDAMWLRDSSIQIHPYLPLIKNDIKLRQLVEGLLLRQFICIQHDPYANAYYKNLNRISEYKYSDDTEMRDGIHERKWELDSLCYVLRLMYSYWKEIDYDLTFFQHNEEEVKKTIKIILQTLKDQKRYNGIGSYTYQRQGQPPDPRGGQAKPNGLIYSYFRPSDDLQTYPYLIPSQYFAYHTLKQLLELVKKLNWVEDFNDNILSIVADLHDILFDENLKRDIETIITFQHEKHGLIYSYEVNGIGERYLIDDSNIPSLLSLPYLCPNDISINNTIYQHTRQFILSKSNPKFFQGGVLQGIGGGHIKYGMAWPLGIIMRGLTTNDDDEIRLCLKMLEESHTNTGYMHESVSVDNPIEFTRDSFPQANSLFGEFIWKLYREKRYLLNEIHT